VEIDFRTGDVTRLENIAGPFDLILDIGCFHSLSEQDRLTYVHNLDRLLVPEGTFLMYAHFRLPDEPPNSLSGGLAQSDLLLLEKHLRLEQRQDGSERGLRPSAWFWYRR
jgi:cyclopropane fatty-acyl-phospholipid synthase-like methyltransferase